MHRAKGANAPVHPRTFTLTIQVIADLYPQLTNQRRWNFQNTLALSRGRPPCKASARWDKLSEATVTVECQARDAAAATAAARALISQAAVVAPIGIRDMKVVPDPARQPAPVRPGH